VRQSPAVSAALVPRLAPRREGMGIHWRQSQVLQHVNVVLTGCMQALWVKLVLPQAGVFAGLFLSSGFFCVTAVGCLHLCRGDTWLAVKCGIPGVAALRYIALLSKTKLGKLVGGWF